MKAEGLVEGMLATQMAAAHEVAMALMQYATNAPSIKASEHYLRNSARLMQLYLRQMDALNKHRGKGQQKVTVEHVHVAAGGQAVVGNVEAAAAPSVAPSHIAPKQLTRSSEQPFTMMVPDRQADKVQSVQSAQNGRKT